MDRNYRIFYLLVILVLSSIYLPGLNNSFIFDDLVNLQTLDRIHDSGFWYGLPSILISNPSGDLGRPIPMFTFALQVADWPGNPSAFKLVNIGIHLINTLLVWFLARVLWSVRQSIQSRGFLVLPFLLALAWGLHPLLVSTVLYVVQRMTLLAGTFVLVGLLAYTVGRLRWSENQRFGLGLMVAGLVLGTGLGVLSKENAALLPGLIGVLEFTLLARLRRPRYWAGLMIVGVALSSFVMLAYIGWNFQSWILPGYAIRDFDLVQRLLTEGRILWTYLALIVLPQSRYLGLFHDDYPISQSLLEPWTTLPAVAGILGLVVFSILFWRRYPFLVFALAGFLWGHVLESGPIPLELYFEHRNYIPSAFVILGLGMGVMNWAVHREKPARASWSAGQYGLLCLVLWVSYLAVVCWQETRLWGNPDVQAEVWANLHPDSKRANGYLASRLESQSFVGAAARTYRRMEADDPGMVLSRAIADCRLKKPYEPSAYQESLARVATMRFSRSGLSGIQKLMELANEHQLCQDYAENLIPAAAEAIRSNPLLQQLNFSIWVLEGRYWMGSRQPTQARMAFGEALRLRNDFEVALLAVQADARSGNLAAARSSLDHARSILDGYNPVKRMAYEKDLSFMKAQIQKLEKSQTLD